MHALHPVLSCVAFECTFLSLTNTQGCPFDVLVCICAMFIINTFILVVSSWQTTPCCMQKLEGCPLSHKMSPVVLHYWSFQQVGNSQGTWHQSDQRRMLTRDQVLCFQDSKSMLYCGWDLDWSSLLVLVSILTWSTFCRLENLASSGLQRLMQLVLTENSSLHDELNVAEEQVSETVVPS